MTRTLPPPPRHKYIHVKRFSHNDEQSTLKSFTVSSHLVHSPREMLLVCTRGAESIMSESGCLNPSKDAEQVLYALAALQREATRNKRCRHSPLVLPDAELDQISHLTTKR